MKLPHAIDEGGVRWTFTWDGWGRSSAQHGGKVVFDQYDVVFLRFESSDGRFGIIRVPRGELEMIGDQALMERIPLTQRRTPSPDEGV